MRSNTFHTFKYFGISEILTKQKNPKTKITRLVLTGANWNFGNESTARLPQTPERKASPAPRILAGMHTPEWGGAPPRASAQSGASRLFLDHVLSNRLKGFTKTSDATWKRSDLGSFLVNKNDPALKQLRTTIHI